VSDLVRVGAVLDAWFGKRPEVDPSRPNDLGRATPHELEPMAYPLFWAKKVCRVCGVTFEGWSFLPQYDDDPEFGGYCARHHDLPKAHHDAPQAPSVAPRAPIAPAALPEDLLEERLPF
jgi:hypothetical protein